MFFNNDDNRRGFNGDRRKGFGTERRFDNHFKKRFDSRGDSRTDNRFDNRRPAPDKVITAMGDADSQPQVAVGGIKEVTELLTKEPLKVHRILFMHQSGNPKLYELQKLAKRAHVHVQ